jgi:hypothetical protein
MQRDTNEKAHRDTAFTLMCGTDSLKTSAPANQQNEMNKPGAMENGAMDKGSMGNNSMGNGSMGTSGMSNDNKGNPREEVSKDGCRLPAARTA